MNKNMPLLEISELRTYFYTFEGVVKALDDISFHLNKGEVLGIVGESGCGKSVMAQSIMRLISEPPGKIVNGHIVFDGIDLTSLPMEEMRAIRGNRISMIFQEPMTSLNPVFTIGDQISEMFRQHFNMSTREAWSQAIESLKRVQIAAPEKRVFDYPHHLSGGMRQRAMIAMALACNPDILIADEPTTALDVTIQAQILDLMLKLKNEIDTSIVMITHDLGVIAEIASRVIVMYAGKIVEISNTDDLFNSPKHPYTQMLLKSIPRLGERARTGRVKLPVIRGMVPELYNLRDECPFCQRCDRAEDICRIQGPNLKKIEKDHEISCWFNN